MKLPVKPRRIILLDFSTQKLKYLHFGSCHPHHTKTPSKSNLYKIWHKAPVVERNPVCSNEKLLPRGDDYEIEQNIYDTKLSVFPEPLILFQLNFAYSIFG